MSDEDKAHNPPNMCDGCQRGLPLQPDGRSHVNPVEEFPGYGSIGCTRDRYRDQKPDNTPGEPGRSTT